VKAEVKSEVKEEEKVKVEVKKEPTDMDGIPDQKPSVVNDGIGEPGSFELTDDEVVRLVQRLGFTFLNHERTVPGDGTGYIQDPASMLQNIYRPSFWVARKV
jgi:hypothetical protein